MLRITRKLDPGRVRFRLEGRIQDAWLGVLEQECAGSLRVGRQVELDFHGVTSLDPAGCRLIRALEGRGVRIVRCRELLRDLLESATPTDAVSGKLR
jgi:hypothetical protein